MKIENTPIETLKFYSRNTRIHSPKQIELLARSIKAFGFNNPVLIDKDNFSINKEFFKDELYLKDDFSYLLKKDELDKIKTIVKITKMRGYRNNSQVGVIDIYLENKKIGEVKIYVKKNS